MGTEHGIMSVTPGFECILEVHPWGFDALPSNVVGKIASWTLDMILSKLWEIVEDRGALCTAVHGVAKSQAGLSD